VLYAVVVAVVYGLFPTLAYLVSEQKLGSDRRGNLVVRFVVAAVALFVEWAIYGLLVLPALKRALESR